MGWESFWFEIEKKSLPITVIGNRDWTWGKYFHSQLKESKRGCSGTSTDLFSLTSRNSMKLSQGRFRLGIGVLVFWREKVWILHSEGRPCPSLADTFLSNQDNLLRPEGSSRGNQVQPPCLRRATQSYVQMPFEYLQGWRLQSLSGQPLPALKYKH